MSGAALAMSFNFSAALFSSARSWSLLGSAGCACAVEATEPIKDIQEQPHAFATRHNASADRATRLSDLHCRVELSPVFLHISRAVSSIVIPSVQPAQSCHATLPTPSTTTSTGT